MNILVVGANGKIAESLTTKLSSKGYFVHLTSRRPTRDANCYYFDLETMSGFQRIDFSKFDVTILAAAITNISKCQHDRFLCRRVNVTNTIAFAKQAMDAGSFVILPSTDLLPDLSMQSVTETNALPLYAKYKLEVEEWLSQHYYTSSSVLRIGKLLDAEFVLFHNWISKLKKGCQIDAFVDYSFSPILPDDLNSAFLQCVQSRRLGVQFSNKNGAITYYSAAKILARAIGAQGSLINPAYKNTKLPRANVRGLKAPSDENIQNILTWLDRYGEK